MTTLYLDRRDLSLRLEGRALVIYAGDSRQGTVPLHLLESIVMRSGVTLQSSLLARLADAGVGMVAFGGRGARSRAIIHGPAHNDAARRVGQYRRYDDMAWRLQWSRRLVRGKLRRQQRLLARAASQRPDLRHPLTQALGQLAQALPRAASPEIDHIDRLRRVEGAAAAAYFAGFTRLFPPSLEFTGRNRRPPRGPVNAVGEPWQTIQFTGVRIRDPIKRGLRRVGERGRARAYGFESETQSRGE
jgi:CRISPR-associated protein Cas1